MYALKRPGILSQENIPSACQVREEFLQGYHELLQRVSGKFNDINDLTSLLPVYDSEEIIR